MLTILYAMICAAIALRIATFNRNGGDYRPSLPCWPGCSPSPPVPCPCEP
ncbi:hypothetical protein ACSZNY_11630 [Aeromonas caviae]